MVANSGITNQAILCPTTCHATSCLLGQSPASTLLHRVFLSGKVCRNPMFCLDVEQQLTAERLANMRCVIFRIHFVPAFIPGFDFSHGLPPSRQRRLSASCDYLRSFTARHRPLAPAPLSHGACTRSSKPRAIATPCPPEPRHHAVKLRHGFVAPATAVPSNPPRFATAQASRKPGSPACGLQGLLSGVPESPPPLRPVFIFR